MTEEERGVKTVCNMYTKTIGGDYLYGMRSNVTVYQVNLNQSELFLYQNPLRNKSDRLRASYGYIQVCGIHFLKGVTPGSHQLGWSGSKTLFTQAPLFMAMCKYPEGSKSARCLGVHNMEISTQSKKTATTKPRPVESISNIRTVFFFHRPAVSDHPALEGARPC